MEKLKDEYLKFVAILKSYPKYPILLIFLLLVLVFLYWHRLQEEGSLADKCWELIDPVSAISTFFITLFVLYNQNRQRWENSLEKLLDVDYAHVDENGEVVIAQVRGAYLAGENDMRQWAQAIGRQMMGNLSFDLNWDDPRPQIVRGSDGVFYKKYYVKMYLTNHPFQTDDNNNDAKDKVAKFMNRKFQYSTVRGGIDNLPIVWERKYPKDDEQEGKFSKSVNDPKP